MANFILTTKCNKGCPYCFARDTRNKSPNEDMSLDLFKELVDKHKDEDPIKLLGGEPTQYPFFREAVDYCYKKKKHVTLITNMLFDEDILEYLLKMVQVLDISFLINSTDLTETRMKTFSRNYNKLYLELYKQDKEGSLSCGITIDPTKDIEYYLEYLDYLKKNLVAIEKLRLSIAHPGDDVKKNTFEFINNKKLGEYLVFITKKAVSIDIPIHLDCILFPCLFSNKEEWKYIRKFLDSIKTQCGRGPGPTDLFPDGTASFCYPTKRIQVDATRFKSIDDVAHSLAMKYQMNRLSLTMPKACQECMFFNKSCDGPCLAYFDWEPI